MVASYAHFNVIILCRYTVLRAENYCFRMVRLYDIILLKNRNWFATVIGYGPPRIPSAVDTELEILKPRVYI